MTAKALVVLGAAAVALAAAAPDVTVLAARAGKLLHSQTQFRKAALLEADGTPASGAGTVKTAAGIVRWRFVFDNQTSGSRYASATVTAVRGKLGKVRGYAQPFLEDQVIRPIPKMTLSRAVRLLDKAGYTKGFSAVTLRKPLYPGVRHAEYIFTVAGGKNVAVDTVTGKVEPL